MHDWALRQNVASPIIRTARAEKFPTDEAARMSPSPDQRPAVRWIVLALVLLPPVAIFAPVLFQDRSLAFRDTATFYYPLFQWIEQRWHEGELPLWNPHVNFGTPVVGEASSSVFYPGKAIFLLPLEFSWKFK